MPNPRLRKLPVTVLKDSVGFQIPASGVDVTPYKPGGIADRPHTTALTTGAGKVLNLRDSSMLVVGDVLQKQTTSGITATVTAIPTGAQATVTVAGGTMTLATNDRLVIVGPAGRVPTIYTDPVGIVTTSTLTTDANGYAQCYVRERSVHVLIGMTSGSITPIFREYELSGDDETWINALNYATIQDAIDACPTVFGNRVGTLFIPSGTWSLPAYLNVNKSIRIIGDGIGSTILLFDGAYNTDVMRISVSNVTVENLTIQSESPGAGTGRGIVIGGASPIGNLTIRNIEIVSPPSWGIYMAGGEGGNSYISHSLFERIYIPFSRADGAFYGGKDSFVISIESCNFAPTVGYGIHAKNPTCWDIRSTEVAPAANTKGIFMELAGSGSPDDGPISIRINNCDIETVGGSTAAPIHIQNGRDIGLYDNYIFKFDDGVHMEDCEGVVLVNNAYKDLTNHDVKLTDCTRVQIVGGSSMDDDEIARQFRLVRAGTTSGVMAMVNGVLMLADYTNATLPTPGATKVTAGAIAFDTTNNKPYFVNNALAWVPI